MTLSSGGVASSTTISSGGYLSVNAGAVVYGVSFISAGGAHYLFTSSTASSVVISGSTKLFIYGACNDLSVSDNASAVVNLEGNVTSCSIFNGGHVYVSSGSAGVVVSDAAVYGGGELNAVSGGAAKFVIVSSGGKAIARPQGTIMDVTVSSGGSMYISSGGAALDVTSMTGAFVTVLEGGTITYKA